MQPRSDPSSALPAQPFFSTHAQRLALARQRYFDEGIRPSGLVGEAVIQSWSRCVQQHRDPLERIAFNPVTRSGIHSALARSRLLLEAAAPDLTQLEDALAGTACTAILTDAHGIVVHATRSAADQGEVLLPLARRIGVSLDEAHIGTGAPAVAMRTGQPCRVLGAEHFFGHLQVLHCAAAPIHDVHGRLAAVLDVSSELRPFGFDAAAVVALYATAMENRLLRAQSADQLIVHLQTSPALLGTPMEGLAGLDACGRIAWINPAGARLLGVAPGGSADAAGPDVQQVLGLTPERLIALAREDNAVRHRLPSGLSVWIAARMHRCDAARRVHALGERAPVIPAAPAERAAADVAPTAPAASSVPARTLRDSDRDLVARTVQACGGNVSSAARCLGVSRGRVYRHLQQDAKRRSG